LNPNRHLAERRWRRSQKCACQKQRASPFLPVHFHSCEPFRAHREEIASKLVYLSCRTAGVFCHTLYLTPPAYFCCVSADNQGFAVVFKQIRTPELAHKNGFHLDGGSNTAPSNSFPRPVLLSASSQDSHTPRHGTSSMKTYFDVSCLAADSVGTLACALLRGTSTRRIAKGEIKW